jgi:competence ComEA-like helix-hairpin-helix protein
MHSDHPMQENLSQHTVSLGPNHGYRFEGDKAILNAELAFAAHEAGRSWALQLWACDAPYQGGPLRGIKVAEAPVQGAVDRLEADALAQLPPMQRDYAMVLVLAADGQVHDFSNYPARQSFAGPHLSGSVGYHFEDADAVLRASVRNPRAPDNLSGTLALELWALPSRYEGGPLVGNLLAQAQLGTLGGAQEHAELALRAARAEPPAGEWQLALVLREWTEAGYQTRDFCNFPVPYRVEPAVRVVNAPVAVGAPVSEEVAAPVSEEVAAPVSEEVAAPVAVEAVAPVAEAPRLALKALGDARVSIATGSVEQLAAVRGLNLKLAQAIVRARPLASMEELTRVRGIGTKLLEKLRSQLTL